MNKPFQINKQQLSIEDVIGKIKSYCKYQERCCAEVKQKLYSFNLTNAEREEVLNHTIEQGFIDDNRFAIAFAKGKFKLKKWGKQKIKQALKLKCIADTSVNNALKTIDNQEYKTIFYSLADKKLDNLISEKNILIKKRKVSDYLLQKGFEQQLVFEYVRYINS